MLHWSDIHSWAGITGSPKKKGLFTKPASRMPAPLGGKFPVALSFGDTGMCSNIFLALMLWTIVASSSYLQRHPRHLWFWPVRSCQHPLFASVSQGQLWSASICHRHCCLHSHFLHYIQLVVSQHGPSFQCSFCNLAGQKNRWWRGSLEFVMSIDPWTPFPFLWFLIFPFILFFCPPLS